jgi:phosphoserine phosphatase
MAFRGNRTYLRGKSEDEVQRVAAEVAAKWLVPAISPAALAEVEANRVAGRCIVLLTGTLALLARPVAQAIGAELVHATGLEVKAAAFTGRATNLHAVGPAKLRVAENLAARHALDLTDSAAYADRISDAHLLDSVRHPVAVNPDARLGRHARNRGWRIVRWH